ARELLAAASVLGQGMSFSHLRHVANLDENEALQAIDDVLRVRLLQEGEIAPGVYAFTHDKIRNVVYTDAGEARQRVFHRRAFEALRDGAPAATLAHHALLAHLEDQALQFSRAAGDDAVRLLAARDAL